MKLHNLKIPLWLGNSIEITGLFFGFLSLYLVEFMPNSLQKFLLLLISWFCFWFFSHCLAHFVVGRILGAKFLYYFLGPSALVKLNLPVLLFFFKRFPVLGIKIDKESLKNISRKKRALIFASGAFASMISPSISLFYSLNLEIWISGFIGLITAANIVFTLYFSTKFGDLQKAIRELEISANLGR